MFDNYKEPFDFITEPGHVYELVIFNTKEYMFLLIKADKRIDEHIYGLISNGIKSFPRALLIDVILVWSIAIHLID